MKFAWMWSAISTLEYDSASSRTHPSQLGAALKSISTGLEVFALCASAPSTSLLQSTAILTPSRLRHVFDSSYGPAVAFLYQLIGKK
jgi:hypothetical protein